MGLHNSYLLALSVIFAIALAITIVSLIAHRRQFGTAREPFFGPTGGVQFVWAMVPIAILFAVDFALIETPDQPPTAAPGKLALAVVATAATVRDASDSDEARGQR